MDPSRNEPGAQERILRAVLRLLEEEGGPAVTTRRVGELARAPAPTIYRLFGDKQGLIDAAVERGYDDWIRTRQTSPDRDDPIEALRAGWDDAVDFALQHPALYRIAQTRQPTALGVGHAILADKVHRAALAGGLRLSEEDALTLLQAAGRGLILELLDSRDDHRHARTSTLMRDAIIDTITGSHPRPVGHRDDITASAVQLAAAAPTAPGFTTAERLLLTQWLTQLATTDHAPPNRS